MNIDIEQIYKDFIRKKATSGGRRPGLHVSDLVSDCIRKPWYRMSGLEQEIDDATIPNFYYGTVIHESFEGMFKTMEFHMTVNPFEELIDTEIVDIRKEMKSNPYKWVSGSLDAIVGDNEGILDFKTMAKLKQPFDSYVKQLNFYSYMYYLYTGIFIDKGYILGISKEYLMEFEEKQFLTHGSKKLGGDVKVFEFDLNEPEFNQMMMCDIMDEIAKDEPPERNESYFCNWCPYMKTCEPKNIYNS